MKGQIAFTPIETIMKVLKELEYFERLVKLARKKKMKRLEGIKLQLSTIPLLLEGFL
jgi:hypothetical protein